MDSNENFLCIRAIQSLSGRTLVDPELLNYVATPIGWKEYFHHVGASFTTHSIMQTSSDPEEKYDDFIETSKCTILKQVESNSRRNILGHFCVLHKTKDYNSGRPDLSPLSMVTQCQLTIEKVASTRQDKILCQKIPTPRPAPKNGTDRSLGSTAR